MLFRNDYRERFKKYFTQEISLNRIFYCRKYLKIKSKDIMHLFNISDKELQKYEQQQKSGLSV